MIRPTLDGTDSIVSLLKQRIETMTEFYTATFTPYLFTSNPQGVRAKGWVWRNWKPKAKRRMVAERGIWQRT